MTKPISNPNNSETISGFFERVRLNQEKLRSNLKSHYDFVVCGSGSGSVLAPQIEMVSFYLERGSEDHLISGTSESDGRAVAAIC